jgi:hypothetical protein
MHKHAILFLLTLLALVACQTPFPTEAFRDAVESGVEAADRNHDGVLTNREIKDSESDPMFWVAIGSALLGIFGVGKATQAHGLAKHVAKETDEQWDILTAKPAAPKA